MYVLTLSTSQRKLEYAAWESRARDPVWTGAHVFTPTNLRFDEAVERALTRLGNDWTRSVARRQPAAVGLRVVFGGERFTGPTLATDAVLKALEQLVPQAPLHLPATLAVARAVRQRFCEIPLVLSFETAFFARLPLREQCYGLDFDLTGAGDLRRYGYHGIYHRAACAELGRCLYAQRGTRSPRVLSLCLEPRPELVSVGDSSPLSVTSGATPLEGLPGDTSAGEADPAIVLTLAEAGGLGPEAIHRLLTHESGLTGLVGRTTTLAEVVAAREPAACHAREVLEHRLLLAAGAGVAALDGLDGLVFSGRYAHAGASLGPFLVDRLARLPGLAEQRPEWLIFPEHRDRLVADETLAALVSERRSEPALTPTSP